MIKTYGQTPRQLFAHPHPQPLSPAAPPSPTAPEVLHEVRGLRWGTYAGSPGDTAVGAAAATVLHTARAQVAALAVRQNEVRCWVTFMSKSIKKY